MKNVKYFFLALSIVIIGASFASPGILLPSDILRTLPSFHWEEWVKPQNSLLGDPVFQFEPWRIYTKSRLSQGEFPLWNDNNSKGVPYFANMQSAILYPLNVFYYLLPAHVSLYLIHFFKLFFLLLFSFLYFRSVRCSRDISLLGGFFVTFSAFPIVWLQWPHTNVFILFPFFLYVTEKIKESEFAIHRWYVLLALSYFIAILGGHPETLFHMGVIHFFYLVFRLHRELKKLLFSFIGIVVGFFLGTIQLLPFLEYLLNSYSLFHRQESHDIFFLPVQSIVLLIFPFLLGAPHVGFYRPIAETNFQEAIGGYVGICVLLLGILGGLGFFGKNQITTFWATTTVVLFGIVYKIWPIYLLTELPIFSVSANQRFSGFIAFGITVIATLLLQSLVKEKINIHRWFRKRVFYFFIPSVIVSLLAIGLLPLFFRDVTRRELAFIEFLQIHLLVIVSTTIIFLLLLWLIIKKLKISPLFLLIPIAFQTIALFSSYNPITAKKDYYPETELIQTLQKLPKGSILEVGNPQLPQNLNLTYGLEHIENYDVLEIKGVKEKFNSLFPDRNHWKKVDSVNEEHLREMGIVYVISDYDLRLLRQKIQTDQSNRLVLSSKDKRFVTTFKPANTDLRAIRILTSNFNRENTCMLTIAIVEKETDKRIGESGLPCTKINDNMFYSVRFKQTQLRTGQEYQLIFQSPNASPENSIALLGNISKQPYLELHYGDKMNNSYTLLWNRNSVYLWNVPGVRDIGFDGKITTHIQRPEEKIMQTSSSSDQRLHLKQPYYPGWEAKVDGREAKLLHKNPFIALDVPKGNHVVSFVYKPQSFFLGIAITFLTTIGLIMYFLRQELQQGYWANLFEKWKIWAEHIRSNVSWYQHVLVFVGGVLVSLCVFILIARTLPVHFSMPQTTAVNWLTVHQYPKQIDYFYFFLGFPFVLVFSMLLWILWLRRKDH